MANKTTIAQKDVHLDDDVYNVNSVREALKDIKELDPDEMTEHDIAERINMLLKVLKGAFCIAFTTLLLGAAPLPVSPTGVHTNLAMAKNDIPGKTLLYTADAVEIRLTNYTAQAKAKRYPMFVIDLNSDVQNLTFSEEPDGTVKSLAVNADDPNSLSQWTAFELKASTNNFANVAINATLTVTNGEQKADFQIEVPVLPDKLLFWCCSEASSGFESSDTMRKYSCIAKPGVDPRSWTFFQTSADLVNKHPAKVIVLLDPPMFKHTADNSWCNDQNEELVWSYVRLSNNGHEKDDDRNTIWHPIQPIKWFSQLPSWAYTNGEHRTISQIEYNK